MTPLPVREDRECGQLAEHVRDELARPPFLRQRAGDGAHVSTGRARLAGRAPNQRKVPTGLGISSGRQLRQREADVVEV